MSDTLRLREAQRAMLEGLTEILGVVDPQVASNVVQYLEEIGFALVPVTIVGAAGWSPQEFQAYQAGIMHERYDKKRAIGFPNVES